MGKVPTFEDDDGWTLWESCAVLVYLAETHPDRGFFPTDVRGRANALRWMFWASAHLDPSVALVYGQRFLRPMRGQAVDETAVASAMKDLARYLPVLEAQLATGTWILGAHFSLVDIALGASVDALFRKEVAFDRTPYPAVSAWHGRLASRPAWGAGLSR
jgi:glutathione S-transferase